MKRKKSYFYKFLLNFMLTLCIPILTIILLYAQAEHTVKNQILISNQNTLKQFFRGVDILVDEMAEVCISVATNRECENYSHYSARGDKKAVYQTLVVKNILNDFTRDIYEDIFVYFPKEERIISGANSSLNVELYYDTYYGNREDKGIREDFQKVLACSSREPTFFSIKQKSGEICLCVAMRQVNFQKREPDYVVVVALKPGYISQLMERGEKDTGSILLLFDQNKELLLSNEGQGEEWQLKGYAGTDAPYKMENNGTAYMLQVQESDVLEGYYALATPVTYFWRQLSRLRLLSWGSAAACCILSVLIAYRNSRKSYQPVENVVTRLSERADIDYDEKEYSEFEYIAYIFEQQEKEWKKVRLELKKNETLSRDSFLISLLEGTAGAVPDGIFDSELFCVGLLHVESGSQTDMLSFVIRNVFEELCNRNHRGYVVTNFETQYVILMNPGEKNDLEEFEALLAEGKCFLAQHYQLDISIAVSDIHEGIDEIPEANEEAAKASGYRYLLGNKRIIEYRQIKEREFRYPSSGESRMSNRIMDYIRGQGEQKNPALFMDEILVMQEICQEASMETVECFRFEFSSIISRVMISMGYPSEERQETIRELLSAPALELFRQRCISLLGELCKREQENRNQKDICENVKSCIEEHYKESELSVAMLGEYLKGSGPYMARAFRARYGISVLNYISQVRVEHAREELLKTEKSVKEIAGENGFLSSNVFIKAFKKQEGVTPGTFREIQKKKADLDHSC